MVRRWSPFLKPLARHQLTLQGHEYGASVSHSVPVYSPAFAGTKLYCLVTEVRRCEKLAQSFCAIVPGRDSNRRPLDRKSDTLPQHHDAVNDMYDTGKWTQFAACEISTFIAEIGCSYTLN